MSDVPNNANDRNSGLRHWRSLDELDALVEPDAPAEPEFPIEADIWPEDLGRRQFMQVMGASLALAGAAGCVVQPQEKIVPYVRSPEEIVPGRPLHFATASIVGGYGNGVVVESHMGRPTKVEGNPSHPASLGSTDIFGQADVLGLYDPDRSQSITFNGRVSTWDRFLSRLIELRTELLSKQGKGFRILTGTVTSPTQARLLAAILDLLPEARWHQHDPIGDASARAGAALAFGTEVSLIPQIEKADVIVSLDCDFLSEGPRRILNMREFAARREPGQTPNRLYVCEPWPTVTGAAADHRWPLTPLTITQTAYALARALGVDGVPEPEGYVAPPWLRPLVDDLLAKKGKSLILVGESQPPSVHALAAAMNEKLGNTGTTLIYIDPVTARAPEGRGGTLADLAREITEGAVETLVTLGCNPLYDAPADLDFPRRYVAVANRIHLGLYSDETGDRSTWHIPQAHTLESWGDVRAFDGTATILQPLIAPLYSGRTAAEILAAILDGSPPASRTLIQQTWREGRGEPAFAEFWRETLNKGVVDNTSAASKAVSLQSVRVEPPATTANDTMELVLRPDPSVRDGSYANNGWLQELPKPISTLTWDNAAQVGTETARKLGISDGDLLELSLREHTLTAAAMVSPGHAENCVTLTLGYGRAKAGRVGTKTSASGGFNAYVLRTSATPWGGPGLRAAKVAGQYPLATTQVHWRMPNPSEEAADRHLVLVSSHAQFERDQHGGTEAHAHHGHEPDPALTLFENPEPMRVRNEGEGNRWGMVLNLTACVGCNACVVACQAENNIPVVGKDQVMRGREMHWIRIDRYYATKPDEKPASNPRMLLQPVTCMHCENAPCELVCPVGATTHSAEGLNEMTYNRCVGTRYCSNNCPYKVRRFNYFQYANHDTPSLKLLYNPDVTVRTRGVMEKCTYCVQRVNAARIESEIANEPRVGGNVVVSACQQACPTRAITFGNMNDPASDVQAAKRDPRHYSLLAELNTRPRTTYLKKLMNPNPAIEA